MKPIWVVDDDQSIRFVLEKALAREELPVRSFSNARDVLAALDDDEAPQVLVSDIRMPGGSGIELLAKVKERHPGLAGHHHDRLLRPRQRGQRLPGRRLRIPAQALRRAQGGRADPPRASRRACARKWATSASAQTPEMLGQAPAMQDVFRAIGRLSQSNVTVLITGESGSGKELVARALHKHSPRGQGPFVAINTAAIPKDLLESELFGHERGAFTGAQTMRRGRFEQADGGTLFLDEIGDMPFDLQTRLLRVLSDGQFYRVGGHKPLKSNVRVIAATHQNLEQRVREGAFREDLFHRLNVIRLRLPALRERREDIAALARSFLQKSAQGTRRRGQAHHRGRAGAADRLRLPRQRAPAREPLPLADGDGAGAGDRGRRTCRPSCWRPSGASRPSPSPVAGRCAGAASIRRRSWPPPAVAVRRGGARVGRPGCQSWSARRAALLEAGVPDVWDPLTRQFEARLIHAALDITRGRRIEAAQKLGIGRNTITRKIQELGLDD